MARKSKSTRSNVKVVGYVLDVDRNTVQARLQMIQYDGAKRTVSIDRALLRDKRGLEAYLNPKPVNFTEADLVGLSGAHKIDSRKIELVASLPGWRPSGAAYAWPGRSIQDRKRTLSLQCEPGGLLERTHAARGDLAEWLEVVCPAIAKSSFGIFAQGVVFAGPLQVFSRAPEGALFAFTGDTGGGKTGICVAAHAVMGSPDRKLLPAWDMTEAAAGELLAEVRHFTLVIDDTSRDKRNEKERLAFSSYLGHALGGGGKRRRAKSYEQAQGAAPFRDPALGLTSGEVSPDELAALTGASVLGGARVRFIAIAVPPPSKGGVFDLAAVGRNGRQSVRRGRRSAKRQERTVKRCHGVAFPPYLDHLTANVTGLGKAVRRIEARFVKAQEKRRPAASSSDLRIAEKFGLALAGLEFAIDAGVVSFSRKQARRAVQVCFDAAMSRQDSLKRRLSRQMLKLRSLLQDPAQTPMLAIGPGGPDAIAFRRNENGEQAAFMRLEKLGPALDLDAAGIEALLAELLRRKRIQPGIGDPYTRPITFAGRRPARHLVFTGAMLAAKSTTPTTAHPRPAPKARRAPRELAERMVPNVIGEMVPASTMSARRRKGRPRKPRWAGGRQH